MKGLRPRTKTVTEYSQGDQRDLIHEGIETCIRAVIHEVHEETRRETYCLKQKSNHLLGESFICCNYLIFVKLRVLRGYEVLFLG
jgi:hypothetical protein